VAYGQYLVDAYLEAALAWVGVDHGCLHDCPSKREYDAAGNTWLLSTQWAADFLAASNHDVGNLPWTFQQCSVIGAVHDCKWVGGVDVGPDQYGYYYTLLAAAGSGSAAAWFGKGASVPEAQLKGLTEQEFRQLIPSEWPP
jgi:hypothetical protein